MESGVVIWSVLLDKQPRCVSVTTQCPAGTFVNRTAGDSTSGALMHDNACSSCPLGQFKSGHSTRSDCTTKKNITTCPAGQRVVDTHSDRDSTCTRCPADTYKAGTSAYTTCTTKTSITACPQDQFLDAVTDVTRDTRCADKTRQCPPGQFFVDASSHTTDNTCRACTSGKFKAGTNDDTTCTTKSDVTACPQDQFLDAVTDVTRDTRCADKTRQCPPGQFFVDASSHTTDNTCNACTSGKFKAGTNDDTDCTTHTEPIILFFAGAGGVTLFSAVHFWYFTSQRNIELYVMATCGIVDYWSDSLYLEYEEFDTPALERSAQVVLTLPIVLVAAFYWAFYTINYKQQTWRIILIPVEGPLNLLAVAAGVSTSWGLATATAVLACMMAVFGSLRAAALNLKKLARFAYVDTKAVKVRVRQADGKKKDVEAKLKFYNQGLAQLIAAVVFVPIIIIVVPFILVAGFVAAGIIGALSMIVLPPLALAAACVSTLGVPVGFAAMALLRLFVFAPWLWASLANVSGVLALAADGRLPFGYFDEERAAQAKQRVYSIYDSDDDADRVDELKDVSVQYLAVEFLFESLPQIIIQVINNSSNPPWSPIAIASLVVSIYAVLSTIYKYGCLRLHTPAASDEDTAGWTRSSSVIIKNDAPLPYSV